MFILKVLTIVLLVLSFILVYSPIYMKKIEKTIGINILKLYSEHWVQFIIIWIIGIVIVVLMFLYGNWVILLIYDILVIIMLIWLIKFIFVD